MSDDGLHGYEVARALDDAMDGVEKVMGALRVVLETASGVIDPDEEWQQFLADHPELGSNSEEAP